ncbi:ATP-binding cassette domain-containing protein [Roseicyclus sp.]|uniref:ATP-binding cassette domain-containing protein n=1 Tax=Roseicyclus sp. TaxID=1914329 RepID=UPI001BCC0256|nr:ATP-binding cassette domain-containing protein [Roseicyclus sp.]
MLRIEKLGRRFGRNTAVSAISMDIPKGQMVGIIGPSGSGKSTLLRLVSRLIDPTEGRILHADVDVAQLNGRDLRQWRADCAMMAAQFNLVGQLNATTNVLSGLLAGMPHWRTKARIFTPRERALALQSLDRVGMAHAARQRVAVLSQAGQKRVAIARALAQKPKVLLADDPVAQLDQTQAADVMAALRAINRQDGVTVICALADPQMAKASCDRIIGMRDGRVVFDGTPDQLGRAQLCDIFGRDAGVTFDDASALAMVNAA